MMNNNDMFNTDGITGLKLIKAHDSIITNLNKIAIQRGPIVYCVEEIDNPEGVFNVTIPKKIKFNFTYDKDFLNGNGYITGEANNKNGDPVLLKAVPYSIWANREVGEMAVWIPFESK